MWLWQWPTGLSPASFTWGFVLMVTVTMRAKTVSEAKEGCQVDLDLVSKIQKGRDFGKGGAYSRWGYKVARTLG